MSGFEPQAIDALTIDDLRAAGSMKWTMHPDAIGSFVAEMDFGVAPSISSALHRAVDTGAFGYLPPALATELRAATADWQRDRYGWQVAADDVALAPDVLTALDIVLRTVTPPEVPVILPTPAYMPFLTVPVAAGREIVEVPSPVVDGRYVLDLDAIETVLAERGGIVILCNPYNPVGRVFERDELLALADVVDRHGGSVFSDEIHAPLTMPGSTHVPYASVSDAAASHTITSTSASKAWNLPGLKCAQVILSNDADRARWPEVGRRASMAASTLGVVAGIAAYRDGAAWLDAVRDYLDGSRRLMAELVAEHLPGVRYTPPEGTYIAWLDARSLDLGSPADFFREHAGVVGTDGTATGVGGDGFLRMILATPQPVLVETLRRMGAALATR